MGWQDAPLTGRPAVAASPPSEPAWAKAPVVGAAAAPAPEPMPQTDEIVSSMFGLKREPTGQTYFDAPEKGLVEALSTESLPMALDDIGGAIARPIVGGVRNAGVGLLTLGPEILGMDKQADQIRNAIPEVEQSNWVGDLVQAVTQYAAPGKVGADIVGGLAKNAPKAVQWGSKLLGAATGDAVVTDAGQASTLGDFLEMGPTAIQPDDSNLTKRVKVGAETPVGEAVGGVVKAGTGAIRGLKNMYDIKGKTAQRLQDAANSDPASSADQAARQIQETQAAIPDPGFKPLAGESTTNVGLLQMQKGLAEETPLVSQRKANEENLAQQFGGTIQGSGVDRSPELRQAVEGEAAGMVAPARQQLETSNKALVEAESQLKSMAEDTARSKGGKTAASENIDATFREVNDNLTKAKNSLFSQVDPDGSLKKDGTDFVARVEDVKLEEGQAKDALPSEIVNDVASLKENGNEVSFRFLVNMRQRLSDEIGAARSANQGARVDKLLQIKAAVNDEINSFADGVGAEDAARLGEAFDFYADTFAPTLKEGQAGKLRQAVQSNRPGTTPASATASKFLSPGMGQKERAQSLKKVLAQAETPEEGAAAVRGYLISDMAESVTDGTTINADRLTAWTDKNREVLNEFPEVRKEIAQLQNRVRSGSAVKKQIEQDVLAATEGLKRTEKDVAQSALGTVLNTKDAGETSKAVAKVLNGDNKVQRFKQLKAAASKDTSGKAMEGLRNAVGDWMESKAYTAKSGEGRTLETASKKPSFNGIETLLEDKTNKEVIESMFEGADLQALRQVRSKLEVMSRLGRVQGTVGSTTAGNNQAKEAVDGLTFIATSSWRANKALRLAFSALPPGADPETHIQRMLVRSMADPELARTLLLKPVGKDAKKFETGIRTYITNNVIGTGEERVQNNEEDDKIPSKELNE